MLKKLRFIPLLLLAGCAQLPEVEIKEEPVLGKKYRILKDIELKSSTHSNILSSLILREPNIPSKSATYKATLNYTDYHQHSDLSHENITLKLIVDGVESPLDVTGFNQVKKVKSLNVFSNNYLVDYRIAFVLPSEVLRRVESSSSIKLDVKFKTNTQNFGNRLLLQVLPKHVPYIVDFYGSSN